MFRAAYRWDRATLATGILSAAISNIVHTSKASPLLNCDEVNKRGSSSSDNIDQSSMSIFPQASSGSRVKNMRQGIHGATNSDNVGQIPCTYYNNLWNRLQWAERRNRCCAQSGCVFLGRSITGTCTAVDASRPRGDLQDSAESTEIDEIGFSVSDRKNVRPPSETDDSKNAIVKLYVEIASEQSAEPIRILLRNNITNSAVESLRDSQELAIELSKKMILNYLNNHENVVITTELLSTLLSNPQVRATIRPSVSYLIASTQPRQYIYQYAFSTKDYYLHPSGAGRQDCLVALINLLDWWFREDSSRKDVVVPLAAWALLLEDSVMNPAAGLAAWALPAAEESTTQAFTDLLVWYLEAEDTKYVFL